MLPGQFQVDETGKQIGHIPLTVQWQGGEKIIVTPEDFAERRAHAADAALGRARLDRNSDGEMTEARAWRIV